MWGHLLTYDVNTFYASHDSDIPLSLCTKIPYTVCEVLQFGLKDQASKRIGRCVCVLAHNKLMSLYWISTDHSQCRWKLRMMRHWGFIMKILCRLTRHWCLRCDTATHDTTKGHNLWWASREPLWEIATLNQQQVWQICNCKCCSPNQIAERKTSHISIEMSIKVGSQSTMDYIQFLLLGDIRWKEQWSHMQ